LRSLYNISGYNSNKKFEKFQRDMVRLAHNLFIEADAGVQTWAN
jgi:hypothetical protein